MASARPEIVVSRVLCLIASKFHWTFRTFHVLQVAVEHIGEYSVHAHNVCEKATGFMADRARTVYCRDGTASEKRRYAG
jgi:hypothetical protein